jgi:CIC family chloride channel protein
VLAGLVGVAFTRGLYGLEDIWERLPAPFFLKGALGGAVIGLVALRYPEVLGVGYELIEGVLGTGLEPMSALSTSVALHLLMLIAVKIFATGTTIGSGGSGGVFAPSLFLGTCLGGAFGEAARQWMPAETVAPPAAYALVGMGGVVGATTHAPLTAILIVFELCNRHSIILPLMLTTVVSTLLSMTLFGESIYTMKLVRRGVRLSGDGNAPAARIGQALVREVMEPGANYVHPSARVEQILARAIDGDVHEVYVVDHKRSVLGVVSMDDVAAHIQDRPARRRELRAHLLMRAVPTITAEVPLTEAMDELSRRHCEELPVVDLAGKLIGVLHRGDLLAYYNRELLRHEAVLDLVRDAKQDPHHEHIALDPDELPELITVGPGLAGKTLRELDLRVRFGITVYAIRDERGRAKVPSPSERLIEGETLVVVGPKAELAHLEQLAAGQEAR